LRRHLGEVVRFNSRNTTAVAPAKAGVQGRHIRNKRPLDSRLRGNDEGFVYG